MLFKRLIFSSLLLSHSVAFAALHNLTIVNNTNRDSTCLINRTRCSSQVLHEAGITRAHKTNTIPGNKVGMACSHDPHNCLADVYASDNCSGPVIATVTLDTNIGVTSVQLLDLTYHVSGIGTFDVVLNGGPEMTWVNTILKHVHPIYKNN